MGCFDSIGKRIILHGPKRIKHCDIYFLNNDITFLNVFHWRILLPSCGHLLCFLVKAGWAQLLIMDPRMEGRKENTKSFRRNIVLTSIKYWLKVEKKFKRSSKYIPYFHMTIFLSNQDFLICVVLCVIYLFNLLWIYWVFWKTIWWKVSPFIKFELANILKIKQIFDSIK